LTDASGTVHVTARRGPPASTWPVSRNLAFGLALAIAATCAGRMNDRIRMGIALAIAFLAVEARFGNLLSLETPIVAALALGWAVLPLALPTPAGSPTPGERRFGVGDGFVLLVVAIFAATGLETPDLGSGLGPSLIALPRVGGLTALLLTALSLASSGRGPASRGRTSGAVASASGMSEKRLRDSPVPSKTSYVMSGGCWTRVSPSRHSR
jgi:hypothetical protein